MLKAFDACLSVEARAMKILEPIIAAYYDSHVRASGNGKLVKWIQQNMGDVLARNPPNAADIVDVKSEETNKHGNFFLESWSNKARGKRGWMFTAHYTKLWYYFLDTSELFIIDFARLKTWAVERITDFPEREQNKYDQLNDTWGRCVPIGVIRNEVGFDEEIVVDESKW